MLAPIVIFSYNRPNHLKRTVESLAKNPEAKDSEVFIFSDAAKLKAVDPSVDLSTDEGKKAKAEIEQKNAANIKAVEEVRAYIDSLDALHYFKKITVIKAEKNKGLAKSVITGVDSVINQYGKVIVVEDDSVSSVQFLEFMNKALDFYESFTDKIWCVGGYAVNINIPSDYPHSFFLSGRSSSFAWATWKDRWQKVDWEVKNYPEFRKNHKMRKAFNRFGDDRADMLDAQMQHTIDSWAVRFVYSMFCNNLFAILPTKSLIQTIGRDGSGTHATKVAHDFDVELSDEILNIDFCDVELDERIIAQQKQYYKRSKLFLMKQYIKRVLMKK
ncbi:MAG: sugar transferase [Clostridia bacterium]|nr:sugar transferase [Clostridia bacterium]